MLHNLIKRLKNQYELKNLIHIDFLSYYMASSTSIYFVSFCTKSNDYTSYTTFILYEKYPVRLR